MRFSERDFPRWWQASSLYEPQAYSPPPPGKLRLSRYENRSESLRERMHQWRMMGWCGVTEALYGDSPEEVTRARENSSLYGYDMVKDENLYIGDMLDSARQAQRIVSGRTRADDDSDEFFPLAVLHLVQMIGEAAPHVSRTTRDLYPGIPWAQVIGMRNVLVHRYDDGDGDVVCKTVTADLAPLIVGRERMLPPEMRAES